MATLTQSKNRSSSICFTTTTQTFETVYMKSHQQVRLGGRESSSGSEDLAEAAAAAAAAPEPLSRQVKSRQSARRSKSERLQGDKPRVKRRDRDLQLNLTRATSGSLATGLTDAGGDPNGQSLLRKAPSAGGTLMNDSFDTPDGSPRLAARRHRPPLGNAPASSTPEMSPSLMRRATVNLPGSRSNLVRPNRNSPVTRAKEGSSHRRAGSVRAHGSNTLTGPGNGSAPLRRSTFLDVPDVPAAQDADNSANVDEDSYRLRSFDLTRKGNRQ